MAGMIPQERIQRAIEDVVDILIELTKENSVGMCVKTNRGADCGFASSANHDGDH